MKVTCDSDVLSHFGRRAGRGASEVAEALRSGSLSLNVICLFEVRGGMESETHLREYDRRFAHLPVLEFGREAAIRAGDLWRRLRQENSRVAIRDLFLAALADVHRVRLLTADRDFLPLRALGLNIEIVTAESRLPD